MVKQQSQTTHYNTLIYLTQNSFLQILFLRSKDESIN